METSRRAAMAGSVFLVALATGYVMQNGNAVASRFIGDAEFAAVTEQAIPARLKIVALETGITLPQEPRLVALATPAPATFTRTPLADAGLTQASFEPGEGFSPFGIPCDIALTAVPAPAAMVRLSLKAACHGGEPVTLQHGPLTFTEITGTDGHLDIDVPALAVTAAFEARFLDDATVAAETQVPEAAGYERVALQWQGSSGLGLHAFEYGADYGEPGHVHLGAAHAPERALGGDAGFLTHLGNDAVPGGWVSEVYSFPATDAQTRGAVRISVEAEITEATCGREVSAQTLQPGSGDGVDMGTLQLSVPGCDAIGEFLVLDNLVRDVKIAAN